jgi:hypothetical protein
MPSMNVRMTSQDNSDPGVGPGVVLAGGAQVFDPPGRYIIVSTAGTITGQLLGDTADVAYVLPVGVHKLAFKSKTSVTGLVGCIVR